MQLSAALPNPPVSDRERAPAGLLAAALWGQLFGAWMVDRFSPLAMMLDTVHAGMLVIPAAIRSGSLAGFLSADALGGILCGVVVLNVVLGSEALLRRIGRTALLRGRAFWWWVALHGSVGTGISVWVAISLQVSLGAVVSTQVVRVIALAFVEVLIASYVLRHGSIPGPSQTDSES